MNKEEEHRLVEQIQRGDSKAFATLVKQYKDLVYTLAIRMLKNREEAEEVAQDTFIKLYKSVNKFKGDSKLSTWIYRVAYNTCLDRLKKHKRTLDTVEINDFTEYNVDAIENGLDALETKERKDAIVNCINQLAPKDNVVLTLYYFEELSIDEIAKVIGETTNNVKVKLYRSRKRLSKLLKDQVAPEILRYYGRT